MIPNIQKSSRNIAKFIKFINENNLSFKPYDSFGKQEISERIELIVQLVQLVWNNEMFL